MMDTDSESDYTQEKSTQKQSTIETLTEQYRIVRPFYETYEQRLKELLDRLMRSSKIEYEKIESRTKTVNSLYEKTTRANKDYQEPLKEITDLIGLRIVLYYNDDLKPVCDIIEREFIIDKGLSIDKSQILKPHEFGYRSIHYIVSLSKNRSNLCEWKEFSEIKVEIQIRTVLQHAWASIDHALRYKTEQDAPSELRRRLFRLSGLLELADEEFSSIRLQQHAISKKTIDKINQGDSNLEINIITILEFIKRSALVNKINTIAISVGMVKLEANMGITELIATCHDFGISNINDLEKLLEKSMSWVEGYLKEYYSIYDLKGSQYLMIGSCHIIRIILYRNFQKQINMDYLEKVGWGPKVIEKIFHVVKST
jgi:putative GTP pyrophosphokinase